MSPHRRAVSSRCAIVQPQRFCRPGESHWGLGKAKSDANCKNSSFRSGRIWLAITGHRMAKIVLFFTLGQIGGDRPSAPASSCADPKTCFWAIHRYRDRKASKPLGKLGVFGAHKERWYQSTDLLYGRLFYAKTPFFSFGSFAVFCLLDPALMPSSLCSVNLRPFHGSDGCLLIVQPKHIVRRTGGRCPTLAISCKCVCLPSLDACQS